VEGHYFLNGWIAAGKPTRMKKRAKRLGKVFQERRLQPPTWTQLESKNLKVADRQTVDLAEVHDQAGPVVTRFARRGQQVEAFDTPLPHPLPFAFLRQARVDLLISGQGGDGANGDERSLLILQVAALRQYDTIVLAHLDRFSDIRCFAEIRMKERHEASRQEIALSDLFRLNLNPPASKRFAHDPSSRSSVSNGKGWPRPR